MHRPSSPESIDRRRVLAGVAAATGAGVAAATGTKAAAATEGGATDTVGSVDRATPSSPDATSLEPAGDLGRRGIAEVAVDDDGTTVYCSLRDGFAVVDASDPADPTVRYEERELEHEGQGPVESIMDVKVSGDRLLVSGPNGYSERLKGFFLYDVSDPANPERVAFEETWFGPHNSFVDGDYVYLTGTRLRDEPVVVYDVTDDDPEEVARWSIVDVDDAWSDVGSNYRGCHDVYVQDDTLYVAHWDAGTWLVDVSDPENPTATAQLGGHDPEYLASLPQAHPEFSELPGNSHYAQPNADASAVFVGKEAWNREGSDRNGSPGGIECWDVSGDEPALRTVLRPPEPDDDSYGGWTSHNFGIDGDRLYTSWYGGGVRVYDVGDLDEPTLLGEWRDPETTVFWAAKPLESGFVAGSYANPEKSREERRNGEGARLYAFPEPAAGDAEPAPTMERREFPSLEDDSGGTETRTTVRGTTSNGGVETTTGPATSTTQSETANEADDAPLPGFGVLAALAGGGLGLWRLLARRSDET